MAAAMSSDSVRGLLLTGVVVATVAVAVVVVVVAVVVGAGEAELSSSPIDMASALARSPSSPSSPVLLGEEPVGVVADAVAGAAKDAEDEQGSEASPPSEAAMAAAMSSDSVRGLLLTGGVDAAVVAAVVAVVVVAEDDDEWGWLSSRTVTAWSEEVPDSANALPESTASREAPLMRRLTHRQKSSQRMIPAPAVSRLATNASTHASSCATFQGNGRNKPSASSPPPPPPPLCIPDPSRDELAPAVPADVADVSDVSRGGARAASISFNFSLGTKPFSPGSHALNALLAASSRSSDRDCFEVLRFRLKRTVKWLVDPTTHTGSVGFL